MKDRQTIPARRERAGRVLIFTLFALLSALLVTVLAACTPKNTIIISPTADVTTGTPSTTPVPFSPTPTPATPTPAHFPGISGEDFTIGAGQGEDLLSFVSATCDAGSEVTVKVELNGADLSVPGVYPVTFIAECADGGEAELILNVTVIDVTPPVITGENFSITEGGSVSYRKQVTCSDDCDPAPALEIDSSAVDADKPGVYPVYYTLTDAAGNRATLTLNLTVKAKQTGNEEKAVYVSDESKRILKKIVTDDMNDLQKAYAVYYWTKENIAYSGSSDKSNYINGAYDGFKDRKGDCYTYYAVSKALLMELGIANVDMTKLRVSDPAQSSSRHYWLLVNVGDGWYHFDCTRFSRTKFKNPDFFMVTDEELKTWDAENYPLDHHYDPAGLPEMATESIQHLIDYTKPTLTL